jgi:hypothetical protein
MESARIKQLLDAYFEGQTTLVEEQELGTYFNGNEVAPEMEQFAPLFQSFALAREERSQTSIQLPVESKRPTVWWYGIAATLVVGLGIAGFMLGGSNGLTAEEQEALAAYNEARSAMMLMSENINKGASNIAYLDFFNEGQAKLGHLREFTNATNKVLK